MNTHFFFRVDYYSLKIFCTNHLNGGLNALIRRHCYECRSDDCGWL